MRLFAQLREFELATHPDTRDALVRRWAELPDEVRAPAQALGQHAVGCEGTHRVFPRCNLACTPCCHSRDANRVAVDGRHTVQQVRSQMGLLRRRRGPRAYTQLIGGEVMFGRRGISRPPDEASLNPYRKGFVDMFPRCAASMACDSSWRTT